MKRIAWLALSALGCLLTSPALADLHTPSVRIECAAKPHFVQPDQLFETEIVITAARTVEIQSLELVASKWTSLQHDAPYNAHLEAGETLRFRMVGIPGDLENPVVIRVVTGEEEIEEQLVLRSWARDPEIRGVKLLQRLDPAALAKMPVASYDPSTIIAKPADFEIPPPVDDPMYGQDPEDTDDPPSEGSSKGYNLHVLGRFLYLRDDGVVVPLDNATVRLYDEDSTWDEHLGTTVTDVNGYFVFDVNWDPCLFCDSTPDLYAEAESENDWLEVEQDTILEGNYYWKTGVWDDYGGSNLDMGGWMIGAGEYRIQADIFTVIVRAHRWLLENDTINLPKVDVQYPSDDCGEGSSGACYDSYWEHIHIDSEHGWNNGTYIHEYGHHLMYHEAGSYSPDYCNGICDDGECGHCRWCPEKDFVAVQEGFPNWWADLMARAWPERYGTEPHGFPNCEDLYKCTSDGFNEWAEPNITEGFFGALLRDIEDSEQDQHDDYPENGGQKDRLAMGIDEIFDTMFDRNDPGHQFTVPASPMEFLLNFQGRYPGQLPLLWRTARNCGYETDYAPPGLPENLTSPTHVEGIATPNAYVELHWDAPDDDVSGLRGYSYVLNAYTPLEPSENVNLAYTQSKTIGPLSPGSYWFTMKAVDYAGHWTEDYVTYGPIVVRDPTPVDIAWTQLPSWDYPLVPRSATGATFFDAEVTPTLPGDACCTYYNFAGWNAGETPIGEDQFWVDIFVDEKLEYTHVQLDIAPSEVYWDVDLAADTIDAGRHTLEIRHDNPGLVAEENETNNVWAHQFVWQPPYLTPHLQTLRGGGVPDPTAGWASVTDGSPTYYNVVGHSLYNYGGWAGVAMVAADVQNDYDLRLYYASTGAENGFAAPMQVSANGPGFLDAVFVNRDQTGTQDWDVGVMFADGDRNGAYHIEHVTGIPIPVTNVRSITWNENAFLDLTELPIGPDNGAITVKLEWQEGYVGDGYVHMGSYHPYTQYARINTVANHCTLNPNPGSSTSFLMEAPVEGTYCIVVWRDPWQSTAATRMKLTIEPQKPNLLPFQPLNWDAEIVPTDRATSSDLVELPRSLPGDQSATYWNWSIGNSSFNPTTASGGFDVDVHRDGMAVASYAVPNLLGQQVYMLNETTPEYVRGGRHSVSLVADVSEEVDEVSEIDNTTGGQYVWAPAVMTRDETTLRSAPPDPIGGWVELPPSAMYPNCDGMRTPLYNSAGVDGDWAAIATLPEAGVGVSLGLYGTSSGCLDGYAEPLVLSDWGPGLSDYVLLNLHSVSTARYDVGVQRSVGVGPYHIQSVSSTPLVYDPRVRRYGPFELAQEDLLALHDFEGLLGGQSIRLVNELGGVDLGISLHFSHTLYQAKSGATAAAWSNGPGEDEYVMADQTKSGPVCIAVWRRNYEGFGTRVRYYLEITSGLTDTPPATPMAVTGIEWIAPNPFNPRVTIAYRLENSARVRLCVYDMAGRLVRTLVAGEVIAAGRRETVWDGRDEIGRVVSSGVYFCRLEAGDFQQAIRMTLIK